jgi:hypothetical protein
MKIATFCAFCWRLAATAMILQVAGAQTLAGNESSSGAAESHSAPSAKTSFTAIKFARQVQVLPDGKLRFIKNERYPTRIARDADGKLMMQVVHSDSLLPECDHLELRTPPICPVWGIFVIDPEAHKITHWLEGERAAHITLEMLLSEANLEKATRLTSELPDPAPEFHSDEGRISSEDLGEKVIAGVPAHGSRTTLFYTVNESGQQVGRKKIHEVWIAPEMKLIVRVIDGDPNGIETIRGLENISFRPDASLFLPPAEYKMQHQKSDTAAAHDFEWLETWFAK